MRAASRRHGRRPFAVVDLPLAEPLGWLATFGFPPEKRPAARIPRRQAKSDTLFMNVEQLTERIRQLVLERQTLRDCRATTSELERNRREIVRRQRELSYAAIESHRSEQRALTPAA